MWLPTLSFLIDFGLKSTLSDMTIATEAWDLHLRGDLREHSFLPAGLSAFQT
jgi:hypothetical protein